MKVGWQEIQELLVDPVDHSPLTANASHTELVSTAGHRYPVVAGQPVLLPAEGLESGGWRFDPIKAGDEVRPKPKSRRLQAARRVKRWLRRGSGAGWRARDAFVSGVRSLPISGDRLVLVVGGAAVGHGSESVLDAQDLKVISFDIYPTAVTTFVADGHRIPIADASIDGVWIQAVLEHVYIPQCVVHEMSRVLRPGGVLYAETPFLQPVHEGAFDFTRFSQSGHRLLFPGFDEIARSSIGGPGRLMTLAFRGMVGGLTRSSSLARLAYAIAAPISLLDRFVNDEWRIDFASAVVFVGRKRPGSPDHFVPTEEYGGAQR